MQQVHHLETRIGRKPIHRGDGAQANKTLVVLQESADFHDAPGGDPKRGLVAFGVTSRDSSGKRGVQRRSHSVVLKLITQHFCLPGPAQGRRDWRPTTSLATNPARPSSRYKKIRPGPESRTPAFRKTQTASARDTPPPRDTETPLQCRTG